MWCEIGVGIELPEDPRDAAETARAVREMARKHGQAATCAMRCDGDGWTLAVQPCWDGLEGLACENVRLVTREVPNKSVPPDRRETTSCSGRGGNVAGFARYRRESR